MHTRQSQERVREILKENNYNFEKIYRDKSLRDQVNLLEIDFEKTRKLTRQPIELKSIDE